MDVQIFLADPRTGEPLFPGGVPREDALQAAQPLAEGPPETRVPPSKEPGDDTLADYGADPGELDRQRWGLVVPRGERGTALLDAVKDLRLKREQDQRAPVEVYEVSSGMTAEATDNWIRTEYIQKVDNVLARLPRLLLILGGPEEVSWAMQQQLSAVAMVGRLAFHDRQGRPDIAGYEAYVRKVLRWESDWDRRDPLVLLYGVPDGSEAMTVATAHLLQPNRALLKQAGDGLCTEAIGLDDDTRAMTTRQANALLDEERARMLEAAAREATVLFSASHGVGQATWASAAEQRATQGALATGKSRLAGADVAERPFLPGGVWFFFACYSAGTPEESLYERWVAELHGLGRFLDAPEAMLVGAPVDRVPFVAALPEAALRNEGGPLGVIGHVDLALSFSFHKRDYAAREETYSATPSRFADMLRSLVMGRRVGVAFEGLAREGRTLDAALRSRHERPEAPPEGLSEAERADWNKQRSASLAALWLETQELRSFVLLGDPAARLPLGRAYDPWAAAERGRVSAETMEEAVMAHLRGGAVSEIAARAGATEADVKRWVTAFLEAGRAALSHL